MRVVKQFLFGLLLFILAIAVLMLIPTPPQPGSMPWEIKQMSDGNVAVFGIHLGNTNYKQAQQQIREYGETAIFTQAGKQPSIEAYFASVHLGGLTAKLVLTLGVSEQQAQAMLERSTKSTLQPSGAHRHQLAQQDRETLLDVPVTSITYIPAITLDEKTVRNRFGKPEQVLQPADETIKAVWSYPAFGLEVTFPQKGRTVLQYQAK